MSKEDVIEVEGITTTILDITSLNAVRKMVQEKNVKCIINCAAYTAVDKCETEEDLAFRINAIGPRNLAIAAADVDAKLIHVSTDYVFAGDASKWARKISKNNKIEVEKPSINKSDNRYIVENNKIIYDRPKMSYVHYVIGAILIIFDILNLQNYDYYVYKLILLKVKACILKIQFELIHIL